MPTYEYRCPEGHEFERFYKRMSAAPTELPCEQCSATAGRQMSGGAGLLFKGSGFYLTDYGKNAHRKAEGQKAEGQKGEGQKAEAGRTDAKPDAKSDASAKSESGVKSEATKSKSEQPAKPKTE